MESQPVASTSSLEAQLAQGSKIYQKLQADFSNAVESRQRFDAQRAENEAVKKEFATLSPSNGVYKLVGPVLLKQDQAEAKANVDNRLELIGNEMRKVEKTIADLESTLESKKMELVHIQTQLQQSRGTAGSQPSQHSTGISAAI